MANFKSIKNKVLDIGTVDGSFKNDAGEQIDYVSLVLRVEIDGEVEELALSGTNAIKPKLLRTIVRGAKTFGSDSSMLDD